jgi:endonuclease/exonuclease/phosphatase family metal-dependent hydrolase
MLKGLLLVALAAGTWNMKWFPSGRAEHRASPRVEAANIEDAADVVRAELSGRGRILFLQELRDAQTCSNLVAAIGDPKLKVAAVSAFRDFRDNRLQWQQLAIVTDLPVISSGWKYAKRKGRTVVPRGYAWAILDGGGRGLIACYCIHLKSNYGSFKADARRANVEKREMMVRQVLDEMGGGHAGAVIVAGDFNADRFQPQFMNEPIFTLLEDAGFTDCWLGSQPAERGTHPGSTRYPDSTLDYIFHRGLPRPKWRRLAPASTVSDHRMVVVGW